LKRFAFLVALAGMLASVFAPVLAAGASAQQARQKSLVSGWYKDREAKYFDFGDNTKLEAGGSLVKTAPIYVFIRGMGADGKPNFVEGQHNIVDVLPGDAGYSDLWQVMMVTVPANYVADTIKSKAGIDSSGYKVTATDMFVNCPIVPAGTTLEGGQALTQGWNKGQQVFYPDFGATNRAAIPIWVFVKGFNADGSPQPVEGQNNVIDSKLGDTGYSPFWQVNFVTVPANYVPNSIRSAADVRASGYAVKQADVVVNCPVTTVSDVVQRSPNAPAGAAAPVSAPNAGDGGAFASDGGANGALYAVIAAIVLVGAAVTAGAVTMIRRRS
jgi:hypothetical protein